MTYSNNLGHNTAYFYISAIDEYSLFLKYIREFILFFYIDHFLYIFILKGIFILL